MGMVRCRVQGAWCKRHGALEVVALTRQRKRLTSRLTGTEGQGWACDGDGDGDGDDASNGKGDVHADGGRLIGRTVEQQI